MPSYFIGICAVNRLGRRATLSGCFLGGGIACLITGLIPDGILYNKCSFFFCSFILNMIVIHINRCCGVADKLCNRGEIIYDLRVYDTLFLYSGNVSNFSAQHGCRCMFHRRKNWWYSSSFHSRTSMLISSNNCAAQVITCTFSLFNRAGLSMLPCLT